MCNSLSSKDVLVRFDVFWASAVDPIGSGAYQFMNLVQESWYLKPYLDEIEAEKKQRVESSGKFYFYYCCVLCF